jgi:uncharacterized protein (DUF2235 family)
MSKTNKKLVFCFDGTSNTLEIENPTNVAITAAAVKNTSKAGPQIVYYDEGVGSTRQDAVLGGAVGAGLYDKVIEAYKFLVFNYEADDDIYIFGFSRGAYTARSFAGLVHHVGVVNSCYAEKIKVAAALYRNRDKKAVIDDLDEINDFRGKYVPDVCASDQDAAWRARHLPGFDPAAAPIVRVRYIGVWDTVKSIGDPLLGDRDHDGDYDAAEFHDDRLYASVVAARHAVALDERRKKFNVTPWSNIDELNRGKKAAIDDPGRPYQQVWFPGGHGSVGGGGNVKGLSDEALLWVLEGAKNEDLELDITTASKIWGIRPNVLAQLENSDGPKSWKLSDVAMRMLPKEDRVGPTQLHEVSQSARVRWAAPDGQTPEDGRYRPRTLQAVSAQLDAAIADFRPWEYEAHGGYAAPGTKLPNFRTTDGREFRRYVVSAGDTLGKIAKALLGDAKRSGEILALNRTTVMEPARISVGQALNIPLT